MVRTRLCTIICAYFQPELTAEDIIEELDEAMSKTSRSDQILLAGDLNCRIDIPSKKTNLVIEYLEEEGFHMINTSSENTYVGPNGTSTIDLVFINDGIKEISQSVLSNITVRKHLPVETILETKKLHRNTTVQRRLQLTRNLEISKLQETDVQNI